MNKNYTSIEQSKRLLELGLDPKSADMNWHDMPGIGKFVRAFPYVHENGATEGFLPCWSVGALLELMPICNLYDERTKKYPSRWSFNYNGDTMIDYHETSADNIIDAAYDMMVWLLENNYINK